MILVIGGYKSGKKEFVLSNFNYKKEEFSSKLKNNSKVFYDLQEIDNANKYEIIEILLKKEIVICNEIGCGLVPMNKDDREKREYIGKICVELAKNAENVYRVHAGIGIKIK